MGRMRPSLIALPLASIVVLGLAGCGDVYYQTRYIPPSVDDVYSTSERMTWSGDRQVYELPANPPAIDDLHRQRVDCKRPGQEFKPVAMVGLADATARYQGPPDGMIVGGINDGPLPGNALPPMKGLPLAAWGDDRGMGARENIGVNPIGDSDHGPFPFRGSGTTTIPPNPLSAYRDDQTNWCPPR
jgi:hypothetical protein